MGSRQSRSSLSWPRRSRRPPSLPSARRRRVLRSSHSSVALHPPVFPDRALTRPGLTPRACVCPDTPRGERSRPWSQTHEQEQEAGMRAVITTAVLLLALATALPPGAAQAQSVNETEMQSLRDEIRRLNDRLNKMEDSSKPQVAPAVAPTPVAPTPPSETVAPANAPTPLPAGVVTAQVPPATGEREIKLERDHPFEIVGLPKPEVAGFRIGGFFVGSVNVNNRLQLN